MAKNSPPEGESELITESAAAELMGKHVVVGLTFVDADQNPIRLT
jgi:hypothetical protein